MKKYLLCCLILLLSCQVWTKTPPEKFKNPIFNETILSDNVNYSEYIELKLTPTFWGKGNMKAFDHDCQFVTEDEKAVLLKCHPHTSFKEDLIIYYLFTAKYKYKDMCRIWKCIYRDFLENDPDGLPHYSKVQNCEGEESFDSSYDYPKINCYDEITSRGWERYLPKSYREKLENSKQ